ncbi:MAG TPA: O-methyltransferase [Thermoanaerobaculia bacterium]|nr:O-methyltransferase [Thermoanaerobaculia bacterium]
MKHGTGLILRPEQERYLDRLLPPRDPLLQEMEAEGEKGEIPISDAEVGRLLEILARATHARRIVEVGTAIGYGTVCLARGAPEARVISIDVDRERLGVARAYLGRAGVADRVELIEGPALEVLLNLPGPIDLAYIDAVKKEYRRYLDLLLPRLKVGGMVVIDNLLWGGKVAEPAEGDDDPDAEAIRAFNGYLMMHPQLRSVLLPLGDGVGIATKTKPLISELGGPF